MGEIWEKYGRNGGERVKEGRLVFVAGVFEPFDEFGQVVEGAEACFEGFVGHGAEFDVADESGAVEFADEGFDSGIDTNEEVFLVGGGLVGVDVGGDVGECYAESYDVGFFFVFELQECHFGCFETVFFEDDFEPFALGLAAP